jgi:HlyD family secretion protein
MRASFYVSIVTFFVLTSCGKQEYASPRKVSSIVESVYASGTIIPKNEHAMFSLVNGVVLKKYVKDGDVVKKGQILYEISSDAPSARLNSVRAAYEKSASDAGSNSSILSDLRSAYENAQSKFALDSALYFKYKKLIDADAVSQLQLDQAQVQYGVSANAVKSAKEKYSSAKRDLQVSLSSAQSQLSSAENDLNNFIIRSDIDGIIFKTFKEVGETVRMNENLALLGETTSRIIKMQVDQMDIEKVKIGQTVLFKTDVVGNKISEAKISRIYPLMNENDQTFRVDAELPDSLSLVFVHITVESNIMIQEKKNALVIPRKLLMKGDSVNVNDNGSAKVIAVKTGIVTLDEAEILSGLDENTELIVPTEK